MQWRIVSNRERALTTRRGSFVRARQQSFWAIVESAKVVGDPAQLLLEAVRVRESFRDSWRKLWMLIVYPIAMLVFAIAIGIVFTNLMDFEFLETFGLAE